jgi:hypothetical protein
VFAEDRPPFLGRQVLGADQLLVLECRDARTFPVTYLELLEVPHALIGNGGVEQVVVDVGQHQAGAVHGEDRVRGLDDAVHRFLDPHLAETQLAELIQRVAHVVHRDAHLAAPTVL